MVASDVPYWFAPIIGLGGVLVGSLVNGAIVWRRDKGLDVQRAADQLRDDRRRWDDHSREAVAELLIVSLDYIALSFNVIAAGATVGPPNLEGVWRAGTRAVFVCPAALATKAEDLMNHANAVEHARVTTSMPLDLRKKAVQDMQEMRDGFLKLAREMLKVDVVLPEATTEAVRSFRARQSERNSSGN